MEPSNICDVDFWNLNTLNNLVLRDRLFFVGVRKETPSQNHNSLGA